jgi:hypothetical protein
VPHFSTGGYRTRDALGQDPLLALLTTGSRVGGTVQDHCVTRLNWTLGLTASF